MRQRLTGTSVTGCIRRLGRCGEGSSPSSQNIMARSLMAKRSPYKALSVVRFHPGQITKEQKESHNAKEKDA